ncbi:MAG: Gfo/Idh/MocA family oxidoreductase [Phycisphaeraceae bacterium]|nr:Gfo/Idh/MocA family oxidoreductase [Phycisphaeraceae bacterium]
MPPVKLALIGCGGYANVHASRGLVNPDVDLIALCDTSDASLDRMIARHFEPINRNPDRFSSISDLLERARPDAVVISTPHTLHFEHACQALDAGCHVMIEKPMVTRVEDARVLAEKAAGAGRILTVGYNTPCTAEFRYLRRLLDSGELGTLELVTGYLSQNWRVLTKGSWRQDPSLSGGGQAYDSGAHLFNSLCWTIRRPVAEVYAMIDNMDTPVDINSSVVVRFEGGVIASITIGGNCPSNGSHLVLMFSDGRVEIDGWNGQWMNIWKGGQKIKYPAVTEEDQSPDVNFIDAILGRAEPGTSPRDGIIQAQLMDLIYESARTGKPMRPKPEH